MTYSQFDEPLKHVILAAGGTGGHVIPAIVLSHHLLRHNMSCSLITDVRGYRLKLPFSAGPQHVISSATLKKNPFTLILSMFKILMGIISSIRIIRSEKAKVVVGFGGYPSLPPMIAAKLCDVTTIIHEQNTIFGRANRIMAGSSRYIALSYEHTKGVEKWADRAVFTGLPQRGSVHNAARVSYQPIENQGDIRLLITGGSQGAHVFSRLIPSAIELLPKGIQGRLVIEQQCRAEDQDIVSAHYSKLGIEAELSTMFNDLPERLARAHLVIGRAGASTVAEICTIGRPSILIPLPGSLDGDQAGNAKSLQAANGCIVKNQAEITPNWLAQALKKLFESPEQLSKMASAAKQCAKLDAVEHIIELIESAMKNE